MRMQVLPLTYRQALGFHRFRLFAFGYGVSCLGDDMSLLAVAWLAIEISGPAHRGLAVGAAVAAYTLPGAVGVLWRRLLARFDASRLLMLNCALRAACLGTIAALAHAGRLSVTGYVLLLAGSALLASWGAAARYALVTETLPEPYQLGGNAVLGTLSSIGTIAGPALAGLIATATGAAAVLALDALSWVVFAVAVTAARPSTGTGTRTVGPQADAGPETVAPVRAAVRSARTMILADRSLLGLLVLTVWFFFCYGPVEVALPVFVKQDLHQSPAVLGAFWTCFGVGAVLGSLSFAILRRAPLSTVAIAIVLGWGLTLAVVPFAATPIGIVAFSLGGAIYAPYPTLVTTFLQQRARGRELIALSAGWTSMTMLATPLGTAAGGPLVAAAGAGNALLISALATVALVPVAALGRARLRRSIPAPAAPAAPAPAAAGSAVAAPEEGNGSPLPPAADPEFS